jgi:hypothetical protein
MGGHFDVLAGFCVLKCKEMEREMSSEKLTEGLNKLTFAGTLLRNDFMSVAIEDQLRSLTASLLRPGGRDKQRT